MLDRILVKSRHWQLFLAAIVILVANLLATNTLHGVVQMFYVSAPLLWLLLTGIRLRIFLPDYYKGHYRLFLLSVAFLWHARVYTLPFVQTYFGLDFLTSDSSTTLTLVFALLVVTAVITAVGFVARAMKSLQTHDRATVNDYAGDCFLWLMWVIGVGILQPRLNLLYEQYYADLAGEPDIRSSNER